MPPKEGLLQIGGDSPDTINPTYDWQNLSEIAAENNRNPSKKCVRSTDILQNTIDCLETVLILYRHLVSDNEISPLYQADELRLFTDIILRTLIEIQRNFESRM